MPKGKLTEEISRLRGVPLGHDVVSPSGHAECTDPARAVAFIRRVQDAFDRANDVPYAFQAAVFSRDIDVAMRAYTRLNASAVMVNEHPAFRVDWMPFAGLGNSGLGVGGIPHTMTDRQVGKMLVVRSTGR